MTSLLKKHESESEELAFFRVKLDDFIKCLISLKGPDILEACNILRSLLIPYILENSQSSFDTNEKNASDNANGVHCADEYCGNQIHNQVEVEDAKENSENYIESISMTFQPNHELQSEFEFVPYQVDISKESPYISLIRSPNIRCETSHIAEKSEQVDEEHSPPSEKSWPKVDGNQLGNDNSEIILDLCSKVREKDDAITHSPNGLNITDGSLLSQTNTLCEDRPANLVSVIHKRKVESPKRYTKGESVAMTDLYVSTTTDANSSVANSSDVIIGYPSDSCEDSSISINEALHSSLTLIKIDDNAAATKDLKKETKQDSKNEEMSATSLTEESAILDLARRRDSNDPPDKAAQNDGVNSNPATKEKSLPKEMKRMKAPPQPLICKTCNATFSDKVLYKKHALGHKKNKCDCCSSEFNTRKALNAHMKQKHNLHVGETYACQFCDRVFLKKCSLFYHLSSHVNDDQKVCQKCGKICDANKFAGHLEDHAKNTAHRCQICKETFARSQQYKEHLKLHEKYKCEFCDVSFSNKKALFKHSRAEHRKSPSNMALDKFCECEKCGARFSRPCLLQMHLKIHEGIIPYECQLCKKKFKDGRSYRKHLKSLSHQHEELYQNVDISLNNSNSDPSLKCDYCDLAVPSFHMLKKHCIIVHNKALVQTCKYCEYRTNSVSLLKKHLMNVHDQKTRYICEICGNPFKSLDNLKGHYAFHHSDERNFKCLKCEKTFKNKSGLVRHEKTHFNEKPHECYCGARHNQLANLKRHLKTVHGNHSKNKKSFQHNNKSENAIESRNQHRDSLESINVNEIVSLSTPSLPTQNLTVIPNLPPQDDSLRESNDLLLTASDAVLMADASEVSDPSTPHYAVLDSQLFHLIPSTFQLNQDNLHTVSFVGGEFHTLSIAPPYASAPGIEESFAVPVGHLDPNLSQPSQSFATTSSPLDNSNSDGNINSPAIDFSVSSLEKLNDARSQNSLVEVKEDSKQASLDLESTISEGDLNFVPSSLHELGYVDGAEGSSLPSTGYIVQQSFPSEILHSDIIF